MKFITLATIAVFSFSVSAFPSIALEAAQLATRDTEHTNPNARVAHERRLNGILPGFNAEEQLIDVSGKHTLSPPDFSAGDLQGPCPGLNALANHNYLPHNGFATIDQFVSALIKSSEW